LAEAIEPVVFEFLLPNNAAFSADFAAVTLLSGATFFKGLRPTGASE
jgi:hypothetical protein